MAIIYSTQVIA